jgi:hypothetical protein
MGPIATFTPSTSHGVRHKSTAKELSSTYMGDKRPS